MVYKVGLAVSIAAMALTSCGKKDGGSNRGDGLSGERGVIQGVVIDAFTGERVDIPASNGARGINVLVQHTYKGAKAKSANYGKEDAELVKGEYFISNIPVGQSFPIVANIDGYQTFEGEVEVAEENSGQRHACETKECRDAIAVPTRIANIAVYPKGKFTKDVTLEIRKGDERISNAEILIKPTSLVDEGVKLTDNNDFLASKTTRVAPISKKTNNDGNVEIKGGELILGQTYGFVIHPGRSDEGDHSGTFVVGKHLQAASPGLALSDEENDRFKVRIQIP